MLVSNKKIVRLFLVLFSTLFENLYCFTFTQATLCITNPCHLLPLYSSAMARCIRWVEMPALLVIITITLFRTYRSGF